MNVTFPPELVRKKKKIKMHTQNVLRLYILPNNQLNFNKSVTKERERGLYDFVPYSSDP